jgi:D-alanyl-lipoteichoic acid acyltransferase DltB (MBOAT superfamily)
VLLVNFSISFFHPSSVLVPIFTWTFNIAILFANEYFQGYQFRDILPWLIAGEGAGVGYAMDHFLGGGLLPRWQVSFNITVLRMISYNLDYYWAAVRAEEGDGEEGSIIEVGRLAPSAEEDVDPESCRGDDICSEEALDSGEEEQLMMNGVLKKKRADPVNVSERDRIDTPARVEEYALLNYLAYVLYTPLYLAGPIVTFNDFVHQVCPLIMASISHSY